MYDVDKEYNIRFVRRLTKSITGFSRDILLESNALTIVNDYSVVPSGYFELLVERRDNRIPQVTFYGVAMTTMLV
ncbi:stage II sporulation protein D [Fervidobacterium gondwanense DSM 13020]|uniref:Stage II sporulation protein D n=1 Tax=Fervidobacterium gondwanense DSM 13020 TaxID=1121883 RepID=A0A1M7T3B5_FERGO|nr:stage II sporulation protein D [Fervidobacterium gondwanense DSM 13020]